MYEGRNPANIIFLGDSRVDRNVSYKYLEEKTGRRCLNLGLGGNNVKISEILLKDYIERYGKPQLVVIDLGHSMVKPNSMGEMRIFSFWSQRMAELAYSIDPVYAQFEYIFSILLFNDPSFWRLFLEIFRVNQSRLLNNTIPKVQIDKWRNEGNNEVLPVYKENMEALSRICSYVNSENIRLRLLISPIWNDYKKSIINYSAWKSEIKNSVGKYKIYDYSEAFNQNTKYFNDVLHLNKTGAKIFTELLIDDMRLNSSDWK